MAAQAPPDFDIKSVTATGPGLISGKTGTATHFTVYFANYSATEREKNANSPDLRDGIDFQLEGPSEPAPLTCSSNICDGSVDVTYTPILKGAYRLAITMFGSHIEGSPFFINVEGESIKAHKLALRTTVCFETIKKGFLTLGMINRIRINVGDKMIGGGLTVAMAGPKGAKADLKMIEDPQNPKYLVTCCPNMKGEYLLYVKIGGEDVPGSPYRLRAA